MTNQLNFSLNKTGQVAIFVAALIILTGIFYSCDTPNYDPPADHTINNDGFMHRSGLHDPLTNCISCHGSDLSGGTVGVSCYECHGKKW